MNVLEVEIEKAGYKDRPDVIQEIKFSVRAGELVGLIGPNGAGKSTTIKALLGLLGEMKGNVVMAGKGTYGYIPEHPILFDELTLWEHLELAAASMEHPLPDFEARAEELLARFRLSEVRHHLPASFSKGMQQKIMLILGFLQKPEVYIVDEPFIGLDPKATKDFMEGLKEERGRGAGVLMSTHVLDTAERICDSFVLLSEGRLVARGDLEAVRQRCGLPGGSLFDCFHSLL
ncbi:ABC transporter ATP-binding protein [Paenibacillus sp. CC-CFT747]|nr:ABC transporter ATP-binding protein [Paenibacillus sp. CC-CFT747]